MRFITVFIEVFTPIVPFVLKAIFTAHLSFLLNFSCLKDIASCAATSSSGAAFSEAALGGALTQISVVNLPAKIICVFCTASR